MCGADYCRRDWPPNKALRAARTSGGRDAMRCRKSSGTSFQAAIRPDSRTKAGISKTAHKCAHSDWGFTVFPAKDPVCSSPISPIDAVFRGSQRFAVLRIVRHFWPGCGDPCDSLRAAAACDCTQMCTHTSAGPGGLVGSFSRPVGGPPSLGLPGYSTAASRRSNHRPAMWIRKPTGPDRNVSASDTLLSSHGSPSFTLSRAIQAPTTMSNTR